MIRAKRESSIMLRAIVDKEKCHVAILSQTPVNHLLHKVKVKTSF